MFRNYCRKVKSLLRVGGTAYRNVTRITGARGIVEVPLTLSWSKGVSGMPLSTLTVVHSVESIPLCIVEGQCNQLILSLGLLGGRGGECGTGGPTASTCAATSGTLKQRKR